MSADVPRGACLQCEQTREEVRINRTICGSDFTPTTDLIRCAYIVGVAEKNDGVMVGDASYEFDRWPLHLTLSTWRGLQPPIPSS